MARTVSPETLRAIELANGGMTIAAAAEKAGVGYSTLQKALRRGGAARRKRGGRNSGSDKTNTARTLPDETIAKMRELRGKAVPVKQIAERFGISEAHTRVVVRDVKPSSAGVWDISRRTINPGATP